MDAFLRDLKYSAHMLLRTPNFTIAAIAALALGIGTNTAIFSVVNTVLLTPFAYPNPERIVMFQNTFQQGGHGGTASPTEFNWWRQQTEAFQYISAYSFDFANLTGQVFPEQIQTTHVSADYFRLCGATILRGRTFTAEDDLLKAPKTVVLSCAFWQRHFGGDPKAIGKHMTLSGEPYEIIGLVGPDLKNGQISETILGNGDLEIDEPPDVYIPFQIDPNSVEHGHFFNVVGRLKPGVTLAGANARLKASYRQYAHEWPDDITGRTGFRVVRLQDAIVGGVRHSLLILLGAVSFVLLRLRECRQLIAGACDGPKT
jgi:putative ABC transport system permease protein